MLKFKRIKTINLAKAHLPGDMAKRRKTDDVKQLAASIKALGGRPMHMPTFTSKGEVVSGRNRLAAMLELGAKTVQVEEISGTPDELEAAEIAENLHRRQDDRNALMVRYVAVIERMLKGEGGTNVPVSTQRGIKKKARKIVADSLGVEPETVRKAEVRHAAEEREEQAVAAAEERAGSPDMVPADHVHRYDLHAVDKTSGAVGTTMICDRGAAQPYDQAYNAQIDGVLKTLHAGLTALRMVRSEGAHHPELLRYTGELKSTIDGIERTKIVAPCPLEAHAKGQPCVCEGSGWVTEFQLAAVPAPMRPRAGLQAPKRGSKKGGAAMVAAHAAEVAAAKPPETIEPTAGGDVLASPPAESTVEGVTKADPESLPLALDEALLRDDDIWTAADAAPVADVPAPAASEDDY